MVRIEHLAFVGCAIPGIFQGPYGNLITTYYGLHFESVQIAEIIDCTFQCHQGELLGFPTAYLVFLALM